jgi:hypothetical protein
MLRLPSCFERHFLCGTEVFEASESMIDLHILMEEKRYRENKRQKLLKHDATKWIVDL